LALSEATPARLILCVLGGAAGLGLALSEATPARLILCVLRGTTGLSLPAIPREASALAEERRIL